MLNLPDLEAALTSDPWRSPESQGFDPGQKNRVLVACHAPGGSPVIAAAIARLAAEWGAEFEEIAVLGDWSISGDARPTLLVLHEAALLSAPVLPNRLARWNSRQPVGLALFLDGDTGGWKSVASHLVAAIPPGAPASLAAQLLRQGFQALQLRDRVSQLEASCSRLTEEMLELQEIGVALSAERDITALMRKILHHARELTQADSGTIWVVESRGDERILHNVAAQNASVPIEHREFAVPVDPHTIAGWVALTGQSFQIEDVYNLPTDGAPSSAGSRNFDRQIGYRTRSMLAVPISDPFSSERRSVIGVVQLMNRKKRFGQPLRDPEQDAEHVIPFDSDRLTLMECLASQAGVALANARAEEDLKRETRRTRLLLQVMRSFSEQLDLDALLQAIMAKSREVLDADRCTLFLVDERTQELWSVATQDLERREIRFPRHLGIAGHVATTGQTVNIPDAYADPRFNPEIDRKTGYRTRNILCMPVLDEAPAEHGGPPTQRILGVTQILNKNEGGFDAEDETLLAAVCGQASVALKNAQLFDEVLRMKNYNDSILRSIATGVVTLDPDGRVTGVNPAAVRTFQCETTAIGEPFTQILNPVRNPQFAAAIRTALDTQAEMSLYEVQTIQPSGDTVSLNVNVVPLKDQKQEATGLVVVTQDITSEQRLMNSLSRYVSREVAERLVREPQKLGGITQDVAVLFSDIRSYTTLTERSTAAEIVGLLNAYFSRMVPRIFRYRGMLDKFIGDAIMAVYGALDPHPYVADFSVWSAIEMRRTLRLHNVERQLRSEPPIETGIGICIGEATYGNIGSEERMDVTVIGDTVNVASRLESLTKEYDAKILVAGNLVEQMAENPIPWQDLGELLVKGKNQPVRIYGIPDGFIYGEIELPALVRGEPHVLPDLRAPLSELALRLPELLEVD